MTNQLHLVLKSLCFNTDWDCALFWKLQHGSRKLLTCEDAYYEDQERYHQQDNMCLDNNRSSFLDRHSRSPLESAVEMMSYHVHPLGQGIIGEVAVTGQHIWAFADKHLADYCFPFEHCGGWRSQFSAGIKTLVAVSVIPYGVVQLGSLSEVLEDLTTVNHVRDAFAAIPDSSMGFDPRKNRYLDESSSCLSEISIRNSGSGFFHDCIGRLAGDVTGKTRVTQTPRYTSVAEDPSQSYSVPLAGELTKRTAEAMNISVCHDLSSSSMDDENTMLLQSNSNIMDDQIGFCMQTQDLKFSAGCDLHDVLGPPFGEQSRYHAGEAENSETSIQMAEEKDNSCLSVVDSGSNDLLEAVVANVRHGRTDVESKKSCSGSQNSLITTGNVSEPSCQNLDVGSVGYSSFDQSVVQKERWHCLSESVQEPEMASRKRVRTGENRKPRPRDRQLIEDRIKELRQIVPSGSKCSIDLLLERTIKHILHMQSITKGAEKLEKFTESKIPKLHDKETLKRGSSSHAKGSTWAVEVGTDLKFCPIMIENINMNGQMLIQIVCNDCSNFLEIAEIVRSLGLTILESATHTETHGKKTSMQFMVEGQKNRKVHRIDIFWQLMQILQSKSII